MARIRSRAGRLVVAVALGATLLTLLSAGAAGADPPVVPSPTWVVSGAVETLSVPGHTSGRASVQTIATSGSTAYIGGDFTYVGPDTGSFVALDEGSGLAVGDWPLVTGMVIASTSDGVGGWFIGGEFTYVGGVPRKNLAHIRADGTVDLGWTASVSQDVETLALSGSTLYVGGAFSFAQGTVSRLGAAAFDAVTGELLPWDPRASVVSALAVSGSTVYLAGAFSTVNGSTPRRNLAAVDATTGVATAWDPNVAGGLQAIVVSGSTIYVGGTFTTVNGSTTRRNAAAFDRVTGIATSWNPDIPYLNLGTVYALAVSGNVVYLGGVFVRINGAAPGGVGRNGIAAVDATTGVATGWTAALGQLNPTTVFTITMSGSQLLVGGRFYNSGGGKQRHNMVVLDAGTGAVTGFAPTIGGDVRTLARSGSTIFVGGAFQSVGGLRRPRLAAIDLAKGVASSWAPAPGSEPSRIVRALALSGPTLYVGGDFTSTASETRNHLAAYDAGTGALLPWNPDVDQSVRALAVSGSTVYAAGNFLTANGGGVDRLRLAGFDATTGTATAWNPSASSTVNALVTDGTQVYAGGTFTTVNGSVTRNRLAAFDTVTGGVTPWNPDLGPNVGRSAGALALAGGWVYVGGTFPTVNGSVPRKSAAAFDKTTGIATDWAPPDASGISDLAITGSTVYASGQFRVGDGNAFHAGLAAYDATTGAASGWAPVSDDSVGALAVAPGGLVAGGEFTAFGDGSLPQAGFASFTPLDRTIAATGTAISAVQNQAFSGTVATFTVPTPAAAPRDFDVTIDWGDGSGDDVQSAGVSRSGGSFTVTGAHTYHEAGQHAVAVTITEHGNVANAAVATTTASVADAPRRVDRSAFSATLVERPAEPPAPPPPAARPSVPAH